MEASRGRRRVALPLGLSLAGHLALVAVCASLPRGREARREPAAPGPLTVRLVCLAPSPAKAEGVALPSRGDWRNVDLAPVIGPAPVLEANVGGGPAGPVGPASPHAGDAPERGGPPGLLEAGAAARRVVYLLDASISMSQWGSFGRARDEVIASLRGLPAEASFQVIAYARRAAPLLGQPPQLWPATADHIEEAVAALCELAPAGQTDHVQAVRAALSYRPDVLFVLTDADDLGPAAARELSWLRTEAAVVHVVELSPARRGPGDGALAQLARRTGGSHRVVNPER